MPFTITLLGLIFFWIVILSSRGQSRWEEGDIFCVVLYPACFLLFFILNLGPVWTETPNVNLKNFCLAWLSLTSHDLVLLNHWLKPQALSLLDILESFIPCCCWGYPSKSSCNLTSFLIFLLYFGSKIEKYNIIEPPSVRYGPPLTPKILGQIKFVGCCWYYKVKYHEEEWCAIFYLQI